MTTYRLKYRLPGAADWIEHSQCSQDDGRAVSTMRIRRNKFKELGFDAEMVADLTESIPPRRMRLIVRRVAYLIPEDLPLETIQLELFSTNPSVRTPGWNADIWTNTVLWKADLDKVERELSAGVFFSASP